MNNHLKCNKRIKRPSIKMPAVPQKESIIKNPRRRIANLRRSRARTKTLVPASKQRNMQRIGMFKIQLNDITKSTIFSLC